MNVLFCFFKKDHGVPESADSFLKLVTLADEYKGPIVVHCSAGVGRTGTYIAVHTTMQMVRKEKKRTKINMPQIVLHMRRYRPACVQHVDQVSFSKKKPK